jgi:hypothetical protein
MTSKEEGFVSGNKWREMKKGTGPSPTEEKKTRYFLQKKKRRGIEDLGIVERKQRNWKNNK